VKLLESVVFSFGHVPFSCSQWGNYFDVIIYEKNTEWFFRNCPT